MDKLKCGVVRDLMPLVADGVASEESKELVQAHLEKCPECAEAYEAMRRRLPKPEGEDETAFIRFCRKMRWRVSGRNLLVALLAAAVLLFGLWAVYHNIYTDTTEMPADWVSLSLSRDASGGVLETYQMQNGHRYACCGTSGFFDHGVYYTAPMKYVWQIGHYGDSMEEFHKKGDFRVKDGKLYLVSGSDSRWEDRPDGTYVETHTPQLEELTELRLGTEKDYVVVWKAGDEIPLIEDEPAESDETT